MQTTKKQKMNNHFKIIKSIVFSFAFISLLGSCKKDKTASDSDKELFDLATGASSFVWFKNSPNLLAKSSGSGHPQAFLRTRFNQIAATQLDTNGKILANAQFPEGSLIVKELYSTVSNLDRYAILYKKSSSPVADANGWVWGYINANGTVAVSADQKGTSCINCHTQANNIDYLLMNKFFP